MNLTAITLLFVYHEMKTPAADLAWLMGGAIVAMSLLWFRRSKRDDGKPDPAGQEIGADDAAGEAGASTPQPQAPLRIRGLMLLNLQPSDGPDQIEHAPPLGSREEIVAAAHVAAPGIEFDENGRGALEGQDHRVTIDLGQDGPVYAAVVSAEGHAGIAVVRTLLVRHRWRAYAPRAGVFVEPDALELFAMPDPASEDAG